MSKKLRLSDSDFLKLVDTVVTEMKKYVDKTYDAIAGTVTNVISRQAELERRSTKATRTYESTLRDEMAAAAISGFAGGLITNPNSTVTSAEMAEVAYELADAMIAAREGKPYPGVNDHGSDG